MSALLAAALSLLVPAVARAGLATSDTIGSGDVGKTLKNNTVYVVPKSATLTRTTPYTALYVEPGATTVLYIPNGVTLTVNGGNASGTEGAGAGIRVDPGSTLVVTGEGTLNVTGGRLAQERQLGRQRRRRFVPCRHHWRRSRRRWRRRSVAGHRRHRRKRRKRRKRRRRVPHEN